MKRIVDPIYGSIPISEDELSLVDTLIFQRLRNIHQSGTAYLTYPASNHSRFQHSIGVMHVASKVLDVFWERYEHKLMDKYPEDFHFPHLKQTIRLAALLHDIGHGPFSHASELLTGRELRSTSPHEKILIDLLKEDENNLMTLIEQKRIGEQLPRGYKKMIPIFFTEDPLKYSGIQDVNTFYYQHFYKSLISGDIDADNLDYLLRDSYVTSSPVAWADIETLINSIAYVKDENKLKEFFFKEKERLKMELIFDRSGVSALETFVVARRKLFKYLNFHQVVCLTDEAIYRVMRMLLDIELLSRRDFGLEPFLDLIKVDSDEHEKAENLTDIARRHNLRSVSGRPLYGMPKIIDDVYILEKLRSVLRKLPVKLKSLDSIEQRTVLEALCDYSRILQRRDNRSSLWKVSLIQASGHICQIQDTWRWLCSIREDDMKGNKYQFDKTINKIEFSINKSLKYDNEINIVDPQAIIAIKPYRTVKELFPVIETRKNPDDPNLIELGEVPNIVTSIIKHGDIDPAIYVYVRGAGKLDESERTKAIKNVMDIFNQFTPNGI